MIKGNIKQKLTDESILKKISEYDIFRFYMGSRRWEINQLTYSPFRKERSPSFIISNRNGSLRYIDFGDTSKKGNCFNFVQQLHLNCSYDEALTIIDKDFSLGILSGTNSIEYKKIIEQYKQPEELSKRYSIIQVITKKFTNEELKYWNQFHQSLDDLRNEQIYSIDKLYLNKKLFVLPKDELVFGYFYDGHWKIYRPFADKLKKWVPNNVPITYLEGKENIINVEKSFIVKSKKDKMVVKKLYQPTCAVQNEGIACFSEENVKFLKENSKKQILSFDSDPTGVKTSIEITKLFDFEYMNVPRTYLSDGIKDWAELAKDYGMKKVEEILKKKKLL